MTEYIYVLYSAKTSPSGRALGTAIGKKAADTNGIEVEFGTEFRLSSVIKKRKKTPKTIINFGGLLSSVKVHGVPQQTVAEKPCIVLNHPSKVLNSSNKRGYRIAMQNKGVPSPKLWTGNYSSIPTKDFPVVGRTSNHTKGQGFWFCKNSTEAAAAQNAGATHFIKFIPNTVEFRVHVIASSIKEGKEPDDYVSIKMSKKHKDNPTEGEKVIKNHDNGWVFISPKDVSKNILDSVREVAKKALSVLNMDFGAVDIMYSTDTKECYVLEINSSPCLTDDTSDTLSRYTNNMLRLIGIGEPIQKNKPLAKPAAVPVESPLHKSDIDIVRRLINRVGV